MMDSDDASGPGEAGILAAGPFKLDLRENRLTRDGKDAGLTGKPLALLAVLMRSPQRLLTKDEIFEQVWLGRAVSEAVLTTAIRQIRNALGDNARQPTIVETVHGHGYRFIIPVIETPAGAAVATELAPPHGASLRLGGRTAATLVALAALAAALAIFFSAANHSAGIAAGPGRTSTELLTAPPKSLAIKPFTDKTEAVRDAWFAEGLTWEILASLAKIPDIKIASMTGAAKLADEKADALEFGRALGVDHVLEGIVRRDAAGVRVTARLVRTRDGVQIWAQNFERAENDVIAIQENIAFDIAIALDTVLDPEKLRAMVAAGTTSPAAYDAYLQGVAYGKRALSEGGMDNVRKSADAYEEARRLDPGFAPAQWAAAQSWFGNTTRVDSKAFDGVVSRDEQLAKYFERVDAAIAASGEAPDAIKYRAARAVMRLQFLPALDLLNKYLIERPRDIDAWEQLGTIAVYAGDRKTAALAAQRMHELSIEHGEVLSRAVTVSVMALDLDQAVRIANEQLKISPDNAVLNYQAQRAFLWAGDIAGAQKALEFMRASSLDETTIALAEIRQACAEGRNEDAARFRAIIDQNGPLGARWQAAMLIGDRDGVARLLAPYDTPGGLPTLMQFLFQPVFDAAQFPVLSERLNIEGVKRQKAIALPQACATAS